MTGKGRCPARRQARRKPPEVLYPQGFPDPRTAAQRRADALVDLARGGLASGELPASGGIKP
ncbi:MAG: hypothetical protein DLM59_17630, partial [Pseudonocardiales bacterium]